MHRRKTAAGRSNAPTAAVTMRKMAAEFCSDWRAMPCAMAVWWHQRAAMFYLSVLQLEPKNATAQEALLESFPQAATEIEHTINQQQLEEARREIDLLREFDADNFTLSLLGGKLSAARNMVTRQHEAEAERIQRAAAALQSAVAN
jgi:hypothetical protein